MERFGLLSSVILFYSWINRFVNVCPTPISNRKKTFTETYESSIVALYGYLDFLNVK